MTDQSVRTPTPPVGRPKRFDIYVIDTGWNDQMSRVLKEHLHLVETYLAANDNCYVLDADQSTTILKENPQYIGRDPMLIVYDSDALIEKRKSGSGFRCCLGAMNSAEEATDTVKILLQIVLDAKKSAQLAVAVRKEVHREGFDGAMRIIGESIEMMRGE